MIKKNRLIFILSLVLITGFLTTSLASFFVSRASLRSQIAYHELPLTSDNIYSEIQRDLLRPIFISSTMANDTFLRDWVIGGEADPESITRYLRAIKDKYNTFTAFFVSDLSRIYYHADGILKTVKESEERDRWYFRVRSMTSENEINIDPDMANKDSMTIFINFKVRDYLDNFIGATGVGLRVGAVKNLIERYQNNYNRDIFFIDQKGNITLTGSKPSYNCKHLKEIPGISSIADKILSNREGYYTYKRNGQMIHLTSRFIPEFDWILVVEQTEELAVKKIFKTLMTNLGICAVITLVVLLLINLTFSSYQKRLEEMATIDKLTGILNRQAFDLVMDEIIKDIHRKEYVLSVILFDIDFFKEINDEFGHLAGDAVIQNIVEIARSRLRESDVLCRWGGEEFLILLKECSLENAFSLAEGIRKEVGKSPTLYKGKKIPAAISLGVCRYRPSEDKDAMLSRVDNLLYVAKQNGRNRTEKEVPLKILGEKI
ncbi:sensor domain-containing diguanylate cyclase [Desulfospira joergensenii]|uniref:sensor domain-containing diguanylate cyclase n=1 Tax=Desulfospira joergensenii TaxID=53329 RepID=UPI0003B3DFBB|nr:sensor domain-containing diguanylate cyclase [Desulfospira joergensenii]